MIVEKKHSKKSKLPNHGDIKDALVKMILFANLASVQVAGKKYKPFPAVGLTSPLLRGLCHSNMNAIEIERFFDKNSLSPKQRQWGKQLFHEANTNRFLLAIGEPMLQVSELLAA